MRPYFLAALMLMNGALFASPLAAASKLHPRPAMPDGDWSEWVGNSDAPLMSRARHINGTTAFMLWVNEDGRVSECTIKKSSGDPELDKATCEALIARGRFIPATDQDGKPVPCPWSSRVFWRL